MNDKQIQGSFQWRAVLKADSGVAAGRLLPCAALENLALRDMATINESLDFLLIGVGKSGTTSLSHILSRHPDIALTQPKEPWFFDSEDYHHGMAWYWQRYLGHYQGEACVGEASTQTLFVPYAAKRLKALVPGARLLVILRDPVSRAHSDWWMKYCAALEHDDFDTAIARNLEQIEAGVDFSSPVVWQEHLDSHKRGLQYKTYVDYGNYATQIERYLHHFPREQMLFLTMDELSRDEGATMARVWRFLGVPDPGWKGEPAPVIRNPSRSPTIGKVRRAVASVPPLGGMLHRSRRSGKKVLPSWVRDRLKWIRKIDSGQKPPMRPETRTMLEDYYREELIRLENLIDRDLSDWIHGPG